MIIFTRDDNHCIRNDTDTMSLLLLIISPLIHVTCNLRQFVTKPNVKIHGLAQHLPNNKLLQSCYLVFYLMVLMHYCSIDDNDTPQP